MILVRILLLTGFCISVLMTITGTSIYHESKHDPSIEWSDLHTLYLFTYYVIDILSLAASIWSFIERSY